MRRNAGQRGETIHDVSGRLLREPNSEPIDEKRPSSFADDTDLGEGHMERCSVRREGDQSDTALDPAPSTLSL